MNCQYLCILYCSFKLTAHVFLLLLLSLGIVLSDLHVFSQINTYVTGFTIMYHLPTITAVLLDKNPQKLSGIQK